MKQLTIADWRHFSSRQFPAGLLESPAIRRDVPGQQIQRSLAVSIFSVSKSAKLYLVASRHTGCTVSVERPTSPDSYEKEPPLGFRFLLCAKLFRRRRDESKGCREQFPESNL